MEKLYIRSSSSNYVDTYHSILILGNKVFNVNKGLNLYMVNKDLSIHHIQNVTYNIIEIINNANENIFLIIGLLHDDSEYIDDIKKLNTQLDKLDLKKLQMLNHKDSYLFIYDNNKKSMLVEKTDSNNFIEYNCNINLNLCKINTNDFCIICKPYEYHFFVEYLQSILEYIPMKLIINSNPENYDYNNETTYIFCQNMPDNIIYNKNIKKILINTEQLTRQHFNDYCSNILKNNIKIFDYVTGNISVMKNPKNMFYLPYQYNEVEIVKLKKIMKQPKTYDIAFCGAISTERKIILDKLKQQNINVLIISAWGDARDIQISHCKLLLNIHFNKEYNIYESMRCDRWIFAGMIVVSEKSVDDNFLDISKLAVLEDYDKLVDTTINILKNYDDFHKEYLNKYNEYISTICNDRFIKMTKCIDGIN